MSAESTPLIDHALALLASAEVSGAHASQRAHNRLARWRAASLANEEACIEAERRWQLIGQLAPDLRGQFSEPVRQSPRRPAASRRALLSAAVAATGIGVLGWQFFPQQDKLLFSRSYQTRRSELLDVTLPDGSRIQLSAATRLAVKLYGRRRVVELADGEARFEVTRSADRPFIVQSASGVVEVVGTVFSVAERAGQFMVAVEQGRVRVQPALAVVPADASGPGEPGNSSDHAIDLGAGDAVTVRAGRAGTLRKVDVRDAAAWRQGWLVFDNLRLDEAAPQINAFSAVPVTVDERAGALRLTGRFRVNDPQALMSALQVVLPVQVALQADGQMRVSMR